MNSRRGFGLRLPTRAVSLTEPRPLDQPMTTRELSAFGTLYLNPPGSTQHNLLVAECPLCGCSHRHVIAEPVAWTIRHPRCKPHRSYVIRISQQAGDALAFWPTASLRKAA